MHPADAQHETHVDAQLDILVALGYPDLVGLGADAFRALVDPLRAPLRDALGRSPVGPPADGTVDRDRAAFALVVHPSLVPASRRVGLLSLAGRVGTLSRHFNDVDEFRPTVPLPDAPVYAVLDVDRGDEFLGVRPTEAAATIADRGRTMLTLEEGMAFLHADPDRLERNRCFHAGATRGTDRRVPAIWISQRAPHVGWCWEGNHHDWLGVASAGARLGPLA